MDIQQRLDMYGEEVRAAMFKYGFQGVSYLSDTETSGNAMAIYCTEQSLVEKMLENEEVHRFVLSAALRVMNKQRILNNETAIELLSKVLQIEIK
jgi:uncharacterized ubiquitin-like protein YukD